jgi:hypothetical protein
VADHWMSNSPTIRTSNEGVTQKMRCQGCWTIFGRPRGTDASCPDCEPGTPCTSNLAAGQWRRAAS